MLLLGASLSRRLLSIAGLKDPEQALERRILLLLRVEPQCPQRIGLCDPDGLQHVHAAECEHFGLAQLLQLVHKVGSLGFRQRVKTERRKVLQVRSHSQICSSSDHRQPYRAQLCKHHIHCEQSLQLPDELVVLGRCRQRDVEQRGIDTHAMHQCLVSMRTHVLMVLQTV